MDTVINLETEILRENDATLASEQVELAEQAKLDAEVDKVLQSVDEQYRVGLMEELGFDYKRAEAQKIIALRKALEPFPKNRIMSKEAIRATCIKYGLRFLPTRFFKGQLDACIGPALAQYKGYCPGGQPISFQSLEEVLNDGVAPWTMVHARHVVDGPQYYIAAPADQFVLQPRPRDPLLFARLTFDKFFLIAKWGDDLKTGDIRKGQTTSENWNSVYTDEAPQSQGIFSSVVRQAEARGQRAMMEAQNRAQARNAQVIGNVSIADLIGSLGRSM